jgi:uncharacterized RDD family membrane protein YckC
VAPRIASVPDRFFAFVVELVVYILFFVAWWAVAILVFDQSLVESHESQEFWWNADGTTGAGTTTTWTIGDSRAGFLGWIAFCIYFVWAEVKYGQTLGKRFIGLRVVDAQTGARPSVTQSIMRLVFFHIGMFALFIPTWIILVASDRNQRTGDAVAKTLVTYE